MPSNESISGLYAIVDSGVTPSADLAALAEDYLKGGAAVIQLRDKRRADSAERSRMFRETAGRIQSLKSRYDFLWIVNDDLQTALEIGADGVHVGKDDPPVGECRKILGPGKIVGYSSHAFEEAVEAERLGADYVAFGAIFPTPTKGPGHPVQGVERLREVVACLKVPVVAIGGINRDNVKDVLATGVHSVAMISALANAKDRTVEARWFSRLFQ
ncbi:MAG TPA: thiamine phosphate synthase [bacterium]|nr:thiamine phosphate synthase [bacterium]